MNKMLPFAFNPRENTPEVLEAMLVGRDDILSELMEDLGRQISSPTRQHWLIRGPRGIGKTHLVGVLFHRVLRDERLAAAFLPVWLGESDAYEAYSAGMLLLTVARRLVEELDRRRDDAVSGLRAALKEVSHGGDDPALFQELRQLLREEARHRQKILLILMENLDALLEGFAKQRSDREAGRLRALLSEDREFLVISTTPTRYLRKLSRPGAPLFGHLRERRLRPLSEDELPELFQRLSKLTGRALPGGAEVSGSEWRLRWRVLHRLAGGNPRAAVMAFSVLTGAPGIRAMVEESSALLDANTAYYEGRLARLAPRERAIVCAMAQAPANVTIGEIAALTRLPDRPLSTQVKRLELEGHLALASGDKGKGGIYELTDGLFRTWYQFRTGRRELLPLVYFLAMWHAPEELEDTLSALVREMPGLELPLERCVAELAVRQVRAALEFIRSDIGMQEREAIWSRSSIEAATEAAGKLAPYFKELAASGRTTDPETARALAQEIVTSFRVAHPKPDSAEANEAALQVAEAAMTLLGLGGYSEAAAAFRVLIERYGTSQQPIMQVLVASMMTGLAWTLGELGRHDEALKAASQAVDRLAACAVPLARNYLPFDQLTLARTLYTLGRSTEAQLALLDAVGSAARADSIPAVEARLLIQEIVVHLPLTQAEEALERLRSAKSSELAELSRLHTFVLSVMRAEEPAPARKGQPGPAARRSGALARVPPELRQSVIDAVEQITAARAKAARPASGRGEGSTA